MGARSGDRRVDGRRWDEPRKTTIVPGYQAFAEGSALIEVGMTRVLCAATIEERVPPFLRGMGTGWVTAEYSMLPRSTSVRTQREGTSGGVRGRSQEIQRLIGRCLRAATDRTALGERTVTLDCGREPPAGSGAGLRRYSGSSAGACGPRPTAPRSARGR